MYPRGHRGIAATIMLLALVLSAVALIPATAQAVTNQVTGLVSQCGSPITFLTGAQVALIDANGAQSPETTTTGGDGVFVFTPLPANYTISVTKTGYYANTTPTNIATPFRFDGSSTISVDLCLDGQPTASNTVTFVTKSGSTLVGDATISIYNPARLPTPWSALVSSNVTNTTTGQAIASLWSGAFEVRVNATGYAPFIETMSITSSGTINIPLTTANTIVGHAKNAAGQFVSAGLVGWLYNLGAPAYNGTKVVNADVNGSLFTFNAPPGSYRMIVDANGYQAFETTISLPADAGVHDANLIPSPQELYQTTVYFGLKDWGNITVYHNLTLNADSSLPGLQPVGLRDLRLQISDTLGNSNGSIGASEYNNFTAWLLHNGPLYTTTDSFLLVNGKAYNSSMTSYSVAVSSSLLTPGANVWINSTATYQVKSKAWIYYGQPKYYLNMTLYPDTNVSVYQNQTYIVQLPKAYEMASDTILPSTSPPAITTYNYTRITVDPGLVSAGIMPQIRMVIQKPLNGTARAKVQGPNGNFYVVNSTYQNYEAYVANDTNLTFSAQESTDPVGDITTANFTWRFESNVTTTSDIGYGITPVFRYTSTGEYIINLTVVQGGGNVTYRNIKVWVDGIPPTGNFQTNLTGTGSAIGKTLKMNQGTVVRFDGSLSTDLAYPGKTGVIPNSGYAWDFTGGNITDATGRVVDWVFSTAGQFTVNLTVTDGVGWKGANASMTVIVNDTTPPVPGFAVLDPSDDYAPVSFSALVENHTYTFNASNTTDNYDKLSALNFTWTIPGPLIGKLGTNNTEWGLNISVGWSEWNESYPVKLTVRDTGFGSGRPNYGNLTQNISVTYIQTNHPDLYIDVGTMTIDNTNPQTGQAITITLNVTDKTGWGPASHLQVGVSESLGSQTTALTPTVTSSSGTPLSSIVISAGATVTLKISVSVVGQGNGTIQVSVRDQYEPWTHITSENVASHSITVSQAAWVTYAIIGTVVAVFAVVIFAMYYRRKVKAGDWQPMRLRRAKGSKDEGEKEKPKKDKESKEEKKRL